MRQERSVEIYTEIEFKLAPAFFHGWLVTASKLKSQRLPVHVVPHFHEEVRVA